MKSYLESLLQIITAEREAIKGLVPVCTACNRIRSENGRWILLDQYMQNHTSASLTHTICNDCMVNSFPMFRDKMRYFKGA